MNIEQQRALALANARRRQAEAGTPAASAPEINTPTSAPVSGIGSALMQGIDQAGATLGRGAISAGELVGSESLQQWGQGQEQTNEDQMAARNFERPEEFDGILKNIKEREFGNAVGSLGYAAVEAAPSLTAGIVASGGAIAAAAGAPILGGLTALGATAYGVIQALGETRSENEDKGVDVTADYQDLGTAIASGLVELLPVPIPGGGKATKFALSFTKEGLQEAGQEGLIIGNTTIKGGDYLPDEIAERMFDAGVTGGVVSKVPGAVASGVQTVASGVASGASGIRYDSDFTDEQKLAAARILRHSNGGLQQLGNVTDPDAANTAKGAANAALREARAEAAQVIRRLTKLARRLGDDASMAVIDSISKTIGHQGSPTSNTLIANLVAAFPNEADVQRLASLGGEVNAIQQFVLGGNGDLGGLSRLTKFADVTDARNSQKMGMGVGVGVGSLANPALVVGGLAGGVVVNRVARGVDILTNRRSKIKRFVQSAQRQGAVPSAIEGTTAKDTLNSLKQIEAARKAGVQMLIDQAKEKAALDKAQAKEKASQAKEKTAQDKAQAKEKTAQDKAQANAKAKAKAQAVLDFKDLQNSQATQTMFETGVIPNNDDFFNGYKHWEAATGMKPNEILETLEQLAREGLVDPNSPQRYRERIYSFKGKKDEAIPLQRQVQQRANAGYEPQTYTKPEPTGPSALSKYEAASKPLEPVGNRGKHKAQRGEKAGLTLDKVIEDARDSLKTDQYLELLRLREAIDSPGMTRDDRQALVDETLNRIFKTRVQVERWQRHFGPLAAVGNDYAIERQEKTPEAIVEEKAEEVFEEKIKKAKAKASKSKPKQLEMDLPPVEPATRAQRALRKYREGPKEVPKDSEATATKDVEAKLPALNNSEGKNSLSGMVNDRVQRFHDALTLADIEGEILADYMNKLPLHSEGRIEGLIYEFASERITMNMLVDTYAARFDIPYVDATRIVNEALVKMEAKGQLKRFKPVKSSALRVEGEYKKGSDGKYLEVVQIQFIDPDIKHRVEIAKAVNLSAGLVDQSGPAVQYSPTLTGDGVQKAFKNKGGTVDGSFTPIIDFLNSLRNSRLSVGETMLSLIERKVNTAKDSRNRGLISQVLRPSKVVTTASNKKRKVFDDSNLQAVAQLLYQVGVDGDRVDTRIFQEWMAGDNLRVYSKNGSASSQGGDLMKGILRAPEKAPLGDPAAVDFLFHGLGNLLGFDKESPSGRRGAIFSSEDTVKNLMQFANSPFPRDGLNDKLAALVDNGEGFFQVLNAALEVDNMVKWGRERHKGKSKLSDSELLQDADVRADFINYETDFMVQLDASNNAFQLVGMMMGDTTLLQGTGIQPPADTSVPADQRKGADIYLEPALDIVNRVPELKALGLPQGKIRKLFKGPISTYLYAAAFESRRKSFVDTLTGMAGGADIFGIDGDGLIEIPSSVVNGLTSENGNTFTKLIFDAVGEIKKEIPVRRKVVKTSKGFTINAFDNKSGEFLPGTKVFGTQEDAIREAFARDFYGRLNRELVRDMEMRFPGVRAYLNYSNVVATIMKGKGSETVAVPTVDGMVLEYSFKNKTQYEAVPVDLGSGNVVQLGVKTPDYKLAGRGLAAFMTHQNDAYVLREAHKRLKGSGGLVGFSPIHDSFGFHPNDAQRGQATALEVMQELGNPEYNIFLMILEANGISIEEFMAAGGVLPDRQGVDPVAASEIPTAIS